MPAYYQFTQAITWVLYQLFGSNRWAWHLLQLSLHALNATLLFRLLRGIFRDTGIPRAEWIALAAAALFCTSPYVSEVIVWKAAYHFLQGLLLILIQLHLLRNFLHNGRSRNIVISLILYALSLFSLELFYLVPILDIVVCIYYDQALAWDKRRIKQAFRAIIAPQALLLVLYLIGLQLSAGATTGRLGNEWMKLPITYYLVKPPENLFHLLGGRFLPEVWRHAVYKTCSSYTGAGIFYAALLGLLLYMVARFRKMTRNGQLVSFLTVWVLLGIALVTPLWFPERLLIVGDRYLYVLLPPFMALLALVISRIARKLLLPLIACSAAIIIQVLPTLNLNQTWQESTRLTDQLQTLLTDAPDQITILLNNPASLRGAPMIGAGEDGEAKLMHNLLYQSPIRGKMYDAPAANLLNATDSISIQWLDGSTLKVSLTQPNTFWQYGQDVAHSFSNEYFSVDVADPNCCYTLRLTKPVSQYRLLYQHAGTWQILRPL